MINIKRSFIVIGLLFASLSGMAQDEVAEISEKYSSFTPTDYFGKRIEEKQFDKKKWQQITDGIDYKEIQPKEKPKKKEIDSFNDSYNLQLFSGKAAHVLQFLFFTIAIGVLVVVILYLIRQNLRAKNAITNRVNSIEEVIDKIPETELERFLREALQASNYKLAIRIYYLMIIKGLSNRNWIKWKRDKTNYDYLREMKNNPHYGVFKNITHQFERVWYGDTHLQENDFKKIQPDFQTFVSLLKQ